MLSLLLHPFKCLFGSTNTDGTEHTYAGKDGAVDNSVDQVRVALGKEQPLRVNALPNLLCRLQAGADPNAAADWPQLSSVSASVMASPKRKRGDLQAEADESLISKYTGMLTEVLVP